MVYNGMVKNLIINLNMGKSEQVTRKMLSIIRENNDKKNNKSLLTENDNKSADGFPITKIV